MNQREQSQRRQSGRTSDAARIDRARDSMRDAEAGHHETERRESAERGGAEIQSEPDDEHARRQPPDQERAPRQRPDIAREARPQDDDHAIGSEEPENPQTPRRSMEDARAGQSD